MHSYHRHSKHSQNSDNKQANLLCEKSLLHVCGRNLAQFLHRLVHRRTLGKLLGPTEDMLEQHQCYPKHHLHACKYSHYSYANFTHKVQEVITVFLRCKQIISHNAMWSVISQTKMVSAEHWRLLSASFSQWAPLHNLVDGDHVKLHCFATELADNAFGVLTFSYRT